MINSDDYILDFGLRILHLPEKERTTTKQKDHVFKKTYGSSKCVLAAMWQDLLITIVDDAKLEGRERSETGLKMFLIAHCFLWTYPKNATLLANQFHICERNARGENLWKWIGKIAALLSSKVYWMPNLDDPSAATFAVSVDGVDFKIWEKPSALLNRDPLFCSNKFKACGLKYEIAVSLHDSRCVWVSGPFRGGKHDSTIYTGEEDEIDRNFREELGHEDPYDCIQDVIAEGKLALVDAGYKGVKKASIPRQTDPKELHNYKSRGRCRTETFNGRLKFYAILQNCFRHGFRKHPLALKAVVVTVQYQMELGAELFAI